MSVDVIATIKNLIPPTPSLKSDRYRHTSPNVPVAAKPAATQAPT